jgi:hypothetical protein
MQMSRNRRLLFLITLGLLLKNQQVEGAPDKADCAGRRSAIVIDAGSHRLFLCREGRSEREFGVSLGQGGLGKRIMGDNRTPLGTFSLGAPRPSQDFHVFIPVGYPTAEQAAAGFTGGDIGIHGPKKGWRWLGRLLNLRDWTRGCIAVNRTQDIDAIAAWVSLNRTARVEILGSARP